MYVSITNQPNAWRGQHKHLLKCSVHKTCQTVGNIQHHTMTVQSTWKSVCRAGRSADQLLVPNDKRRQVWKWQGMPAISMEDMKCHKNLSKQSGPRKRSKQSFKCNSTKPNYTLKNPSTHKDASKPQASRSLVVLLQSHSVL